MLWCRDLVSSCEYLGWYLTFIFDFYRTHPPCTRSCFLLTTVSCDGCLIFWDIVFWRHVFHLESWRCTHIPLQVFTCCSHWLAIMVFIWWPHFYWYSASSCAKSSTCSVAVQTDVDYTSFTCTSGPATVFISKTGSCYHVSSRCPANGSNIAVPEFRCCRNCG